MTEDDIADIVENSTVKPTYLVQSGENLVGFSKSPKWEVDDTLDVDVYHQQADRELEEGDTVGNMPSNIDEIKFKEVMSIPESSIILLERDRRGDSQEYRPENLRAFVSRAIGYDNEHVSSEASSEDVQNIMDETGVDPMDEDYRAFAIDGMTGVLEPLYEPGEESGEDFVDEMIDTSDIMGAPPDEECEN